MRQDGRTKIPTGQRRVEQREMGLLRCSFASLVLFTATAAEAGDAGPGPCAAYMFTSPISNMQFGVVRMDGGPRTHFSSDNHGCPSGSGCQRPAYLVPGDEVVVNRVSDDWACAWFAGSRHGEVGWLPVRSLELRSADPQDDWAGRWSIGDNHIVIAPGSSPGQFRITGDAIWYGAMVGGVRNVHTGDIDDVIEPANGQARFPAVDDGFSCAAKLARVGRYLVVDESGRCGGVNVSFSGIYRRSKR